VNCECRKQDSRIAFSFFVEIPIKYEMKKRCPICAELLSQYLRAQQMPTARIKQQGLNAFTIHNLLALDT
jgi:hypothetical protein